MDWEQIRIQAAISALSGIVANREETEQIMKEADEETDRSYYDIVATEAYCLANALVERLKKSQRREI